MARKPPSISIAGRPGSGKGTQSRLLASGVGAARISVGEMLRQIATGAGGISSPIVEFMTRGSLVPDVLVFPHLRRWAEVNQSAGLFVLDGAPRSFGQIKETEYIFDIHLVILIEVPVESIVARLSRRLVCTSCHTAYNLLTKPPRESGFCDADNCVLERRNDDDPLVVRKRIDTYDRETAPMFEHYRQDGRLVVVDGEGSPESVAERIVKVAAGFHSLKELIMSRGEGVGPG